MASRKDKIVTDALAKKAHKTYVDRSDWWYMHDRDMHEGVEGMRDTLNSLMPEIRKALFAEFEAQQNKEN